MDWSNRVAVGYFGQVEFKVNETILSKEVDLGVVLGVKFFEAVDGLGDLELINLQKFNGFVFLLGDELGLSHDVFLVREEFFKRFAGSIEDLLFGLLDLHLDGFDWLGLLLLGWLRCLFFSHFYEISIMLLII